MRSAAARMVLTMALVAVFAGSAMAATITFSPRPSPDLLDLNHEQFYLWGIRTPITPGSIQSATLTIQNIYDFTRESNDTLFVHLLDSVTVPVPGAPIASLSWRWDPTHRYQTVTAYASDQSATDQTVSDYFVGRTAPWFSPSSPPLVGTWSDPLGGSPTGFNLSFTINPVYFSWLTDGNFGFGIDPDCHYYNSGVTLTVETVPEPGTILMFGTGLVGLAGVVRRRYRRR